MAKTILRAILGLLLAAASGGIGAAVCNSNGSGNWNNAGTWSCGATPGANDDVTINNGHNVNLNGTDRNSRNLTIAAGGTLTLGSDSLTINNNGVVVIDGLLQGNGNNASDFIKNGTGTLSGTGSVNNVDQFRIINSTTVLAGTTLTFTGADCRIDLSANMTLTNNATITFDTAACGNTSELNLSNPTTFTNNGTVSAIEIIGQNNANSVWTQGANSTLNVSDAMLATGTLNASNAGNTVNYSGTGAQTVKLPSGGNYVHLSFTNAGTKTMPGGTINVAGNLSVNTGATVNATANDPAVNLSGNFTNSGTYTSGSGQFTLQGGAGTQTMTGATTFASLRINHTGSGVSLNNSITVSTTLTLTAGIVDTGANQLIVSSTGATPISGGSAASYVIGCLRKNYTAGQTLSFRAAGSDEFPVGIAGAYLPVEISSGTTSSAGNLVVCVTGTDHPQMTLANGGGIDTAKSVNRYWSMTSTTLTLSALMEATYKFPAGATQYDAAAATGSFIVQRYDGTDWNPTTLAAGGAGATSTRAQNINLTTGTNEFEIGEVVAGLNANPGAFNVFETTTPPAAVLGRVYTKRVGTNFTLSIVAVANNGVNTSPSTNTLTINVIDATGTPGTFSAATNCWSGWTTVGSNTTVTSAVGWSSGKINVTITAPTTAVRNARIRVTQTGTGATGCSTDRFSLRPSSFTVSSSNAGNNDSSGTPVVKAGAAFSLTATAIQGYDGTPSIDNGVGMVIGTPNAGTIGGSFGAAPVLTGVATGSAFTYSEVGNFGLSADAVVDSSFTSVDPPGVDCVAGSSTTTLTAGGHYGCSIGSTAVAQTTGTSGFGRFIPDHFFIAADTPVPAITNRVSAACAPTSAFSYMDEGIGIKFRLQARNSAGGVTKNYAGSYAFLNSRAELGLGAVSGTTNLGATRLDTGALPTPPTFTDGELTVDSTIVVRRPSPDDPDGPFPSTAIGIAPTDDDGTALQSAAFDMDVDGAGGSDHQRIGSTTEIRFGRLRMENAVGSEKLALPVRMEAQYWNGFGFVTNAQDNCTSFPRSAVVLGGYTGSIDPASGNCKTFVQEDPIAFTTGVAAISLAAPDGAVSGSALLTANLGEVASGSYCDNATSNQDVATFATRLYLLGRWNDSASVESPDVPTTRYDDNPSSRAAFGLYGGQPNNFIYFRENY